MRRSKDMEPAGRDEQNNWENSDFVNLNLNPEVRHYEKRIVRSVNDLDRILNKYLNEIIRLQNELDENTEKISPEELKLKIQEQAEAIYTVYLIRDEIENLVVGVEKNLDNLSSDTQETLSATLSSAKELITNIEARLDPIDYFIRADLLSSKIKLASALVNSRKSQSEYADFILRELELKEKPYSDLRSFVENILQYDGVTQVEEAIKTGLEAFEAERVEARGQHYDSNDGEQLPELVRKIEKAFPKPMRRLIAVVSTLFLAGTIVTNVVAAQEPKPDRNKKDRDTDSGLVQRSDVERLLELIEKFNKLLESQEDKDAIGTLIELSQQVSEVLADELKNDFNIQRELFIQKTISSGLDENTAKILLNKIAGPAFDQEQVHIPDVANAMPVGHQPAPETPSPLSSKISFGEDGTDSGPSENRVEIPKRIEKQEDENPTYVEVNGGINVRSTPEVKGDNNLVLVTSGKQIYPAASYEDALASLDRASIDPDDENDEFKNFGFDEKSGVTTIENGHIWVAVLTPNGETSWVALTSNISLASGTPEANFAPEDAPTPGDNLNITDPNETEEPPAQSTGFNPTEVPTGTPDPFSQDTLVVDNAPGETATPQEVAAVTFDQENFRASPGNATAISGAIIYNTDNEYLGTIGANMPINVGENPVDSVYFEIFDSQGEVVGRIMNGSFVRVEAPAANVDFATAVEEVMPNGETIAGVAFSAGNMTVYDTEKLLESYDGQSPANTLLQDPEVIFRVRSNILQQMNEMGISANQITMLGEKSLPGISGETTMGQVANDEWHIFRVGKPFGTATREQTAVSWGVVDEKIIAFVYSPNLNGRETTPLLDPSVTIDMYADYVYTFSVLRDDAGLRGDPTEAEEKYLLGTYYKR
ncbi:MAG: hypothetical protein ABFQ62_01840 [Patescibacteria group bacterium]